MTMLVANQDRGGRFEASSHWRSCVYEHTSSGCRLRHFAIDEAISTSGARDLEHPDPLPLEMLLELAAFVTNLTASSKGEGGKGFKLNRSSLQSFQYLVPEIEVVNEVALVLCYAMAGILARNMTSQFSRGAI